MFATATRAQSANYSSMNLHFVYIDHEPSTPVNKLCERLRMLRDDAVEIGDALIIYLADGQSPIVSLTGLKDKKGLGRDDNQTYTRIVAALQNANYHDVMARIDREKIIQLFDEYDFVDESGNFLFNSVIMDFYVGPEFWSLKDNERVIAHLFTAFKAASYTKGKFSFNVFKAKEQELDYPKGMPFGDNNIDGINEKLSIFDY